MQIFNLNFDTKVYSEYPDQMYEVVKAKKKLNSIVDKNVSQQELADLIERTRKVVEDFEAYKEEAEEGVQVCRLGAEGWNWVKLSASGIVFAAACVPLGASIETARAANYTLCPQSQMLLGLNIGAAAVTLAAFAINGVVMLLDQWRNNRIGLQYKDLNHAKTICEYWRNIEELKQLQQNSNSAKTDKVAIDRQFDKCTACLHEMKVDPKIEKVVKERCASLQTEALPDDHELKKIFIQQRALRRQQRSLDKKINSYMNTQKSLINQSKIITENAAASEDSGAFLNLADADKGQLNQSSSSILTNSDEIRENYKKHISLLSEKFRLPISTIYIDDESFSLKEEEDLPSSQYNI